eukprot:5675271-Amphidinium_carterae.1
MPLAPSACLQVAHGGPPKAAPAHPMLLLKSVKLVDCSYGPPHLGYQGLSAHDHCACSEHGRRSCTTKSIAAKLRRQTQWLGPCWPRASLKAASCLDQLHSTW